jgi:hypothetical protein
MFDFIKNHWLVKPPVKFYSDYSPLQKAWWGLWRRPADLLTREQILELNKNIINPYCDCKSDCGAKTTITSHSFGIQHCPTKIRKLMEPFQQWPWTEISKGNSVVCTEDGRFLYVLKPNGEKIYERE